MKNKSGKILLMLCVTLLCALFLSMTALASEEKGALTAVDGIPVTGLLKDNAESGEAAAVELHIYEDESAKAAQVITVPEESTSEEIGPGIPKKEEIPVEETFEGYKKGESLGIFKTTGYCGCSSCSGGSGLTYSGTVPQPNHTISADITVLPLGTKVIIGETVYTVEDIGSGVDGHTVDLYFSSHQDALDYGVKNQEVFQAVEQ